jgi:integrase
LREAEGWTPARPRPAESFRSWRDKAIAGLMLLSGLRSAEVLALNVSDVDIPRGWALVAEGRQGTKRPC